MLLNCDGALLVRPFSCTLQSLHAAAALRNAGIIIARLSGDGLRLLKDSGSRGRTHCKPQPKALNPGTNVGAFIIRIRF